MTNDDRQRRIDIMQQIAKLVVCAADLSRAVAFDDGAYVRSNLAGIETYRAEIFAMIWDWKPELLSAAESDASPPAEQEQKRWNEIVIAANGLEFPELPEISEERIRDVTEGLTVPDDDA